MKTLVTLFVVVLSMFALSSCSKPGALASGPACVDTPKEKCPSFTYLRLQERSKQLPTEVQDLMKKPDVEAYLRAVDEQYSINNQLSQANQQMTQQGYKFDDSLNKFVQQAPAIAPIAPVADPKKK